MGFRVDRGRMGTARIDHNGTLIVTGALTRTGVFPYRHSDGPKTLELRHPDDVFDAHAVASFIQVPVTDEHPEQGRITPGNVSRYMVGNVGDTITRDDNLMLADLTVRKGDTIEKVMPTDGGKPKRELSCGYTSDVIEEVGEYKGEKYDHRQTNIRGNHVAIVRTGRAGAEVRLLLDAEDAMQGDDVAWSEHVMERLDMPDDQKKKISAKIAKLVKEGKPQDQAVAIAHQMARDGKLDEEDILDAGGEDSRGGHIIGHTGSGKPIYSVHGHLEHKDFNVREHGEAANAHLRAGDKIHEKIEQADQAGKRNQDQHAEQKNQLAHHDKQMELHGADQWRLGRTRKKTVTPQVPHGVKDDSEVGDDPQKTNAGGIRVKLIKDGISIGSGDTTFKLDKLELDIPDEAQKEVELVIDQRDRTIEALTDSREKQAETQGKLDALEEQKKDWEDPARVEAKAEAMSLAKNTALFAGFKADELKGKSTANVKRMVVSKRWPDLKMDDLDDSYITGRFEVIQDEAEAEGTNLNAMGHLGDVTQHKNNGDPGQQGKNDDDLSYRQAADAKMQNLHLKTDAEIKEAGLN